MYKEGWLLTALAVVVVVAFAWPHPSRCYIVHQRKDGFCPPNYISETQLFAPGGAFFIEPDGTGQHACFDLRPPAMIDKHNPVGVGLGEDLCVDFLRPGEKDRFQS